MEAMQQVVRSILKLESEKITRRAKAQSLVKNNDIDGIAELILSSERCETAKKNESRAIRYALRLKRFIASKGLTSEMVKYMEEK